MNNFRLFVALGILGTTPNALLCAQSTPTTHVYRVVEGDSLRAYVFQPSVPGLTPRSAVLLYHGGGWTAGSPEWTFASARAFAEQGLVAISVEYRLAGSRWTPVDALSDVCESVRWVRRMAAELGIAPTRIAGHGVSAGGHLIASTATVGCPGTPDAESGVPDVLLLWSPALDVTADTWFRTQLRGVRQPIDLSPAQHVGAATPPTSIVHGDRDTLTPLAGAQRYCERLRERGTPCELNVYAGVGHLLTRNLMNQETSFDPDPEARADGIAKHNAFLRTHRFR
jgi:acetyl esterase/lipase